MSDVVGDSSAEITQSKVLRWLRLNLALLIAATTATTAVTGAIISVTLRIGEAAHQIDTLQGWQGDVKTSLNQFHSDMVNVDARLNKDVLAINENQRQCELRAAGLEQRIAVLEAQLRWIADRVPQPLLSPRR